MGGGEELGVCETLGDGEARGHCEGGREWPAAESGLSPRVPPGPSPASMGPQRWARTEGHVRKEWATVWPRKAACNVARMKALVLPFNTQRERPGEDPGPGESLCQGWVAHTPQSPSHCPEWVMALLGWQGRDAKRGQSTATLTELTGDLATNSRGCQDPLRLGRREARAPPGLLISVGGWDTWGAWT